MPQNCLFLIKRPPSQKSQKWNIPERSVRNYCANGRMMIDNDSRPITETFIKDLHRTLKNGTTDSRQDWFAVGDYKERLNTVGGLFTAQPAEVAEKMRILIAAYNARKKNHLTIFSISIIDSSVSTPFRTAGACCSLRNVCAIISYRSS